MKRKTINELLALIAVRVKAAGSQAAFAKLAGVSQGYINDVLKGKRAPGEKVLRAIGYRKVVLYEPEVVNE